MGKAKAFQITGVEELDAKLAGMDNTLKKKALRKGSRAGAKIVQQDAIKLVPHDTGELERSLKVRAMKRTRSKRNRDRVGHSVITGNEAAGASNFLRGDYHYGLYQEFGWIHYKDKQFKEGSPFLRPALWGNQHQVKTAFIKAVSEWLNEQEVKRKT